MTPTLPLIDVSPLVLGEGDVAGCARQIDSACRESGFFRITGHGVSTELRVLMDELSRKFFDQPEAEKAKCAMPLAGASWRGWFGVGGELTSGVPDRKEGLCIGEELSPDDARVVARTPLHGPNLFPASPAGLGPAVVEWFAQMRDLGEALLRGVALGLGMDAQWFATTIAAEPTCLFRIFHYEPHRVLCRLWCTPCFV